MANLSGFEQFCGGVFWDEGLTWKNTTSPDLTQCFQETILVWVPCGILWILLPFYMVYIKRKKPISHNKLNVAKTAVAALLTVVAIMEIVKTWSDYSSPNGDRPGHVYFVSPGITAITMILAVIIIQIDRCFGRYSNGILWIYWLLQLVASIVPMYSGILVASQNGGTFRDEFRFVTFCIHFTLVFIVFILSCFADVPIDVGHIGNKSPEVYASFLSYITFWWINKLVLTGYKKPLTDEDVFELNPRDVSKNSAPGFQLEWGRRLDTYRKVKEVVKQSKYQRKSTTMANGSYDQVYNEKTPLLKSPVEVSPDVEVKWKEANMPSLIGSIAKCYGQGLLQAWGCKLVSDVLTFVNPMIQGLLIGYVQDKAMEEWKGYLFAFMFLFSTVTQSLFYQQNFYISMNQGIRVRSALICTVFKKALTMSNDARKGATVGEIVNLMSVDCSRIEMVFQYLWMLWSSPFQIILAVYLLWGIVGPSILAGLAVMVLLIPVNAVIAVFQRRYQVVQMKLKDQRIKLSNEVLNGMKVLKLYAWEPSFEEKVLDIREKELGLIKKVAYLSAIGSFTWTLAPFLVTLATFATYIIGAGKVLDANTAFVSLSYINILRFPINMLPMLISFLVQAVVSVRRIEKFLATDDINTSNLTKNPRAVHAVSVEKGTFSWGRDDRPILKDITLTIPKGGLVAVVGQVGSGKSSLISAFLGEMEKFEGRVIVQSSVAYVPQQAWMQNATIEDNILFGSRRQDDLYKDVIEACALKPDLDILPGGDQCEIGEKGINLSGGQKQRISLARAVYNDADIYYLDDPLSAVDSHVGKHIFDKVVSRQGLLKNKTRVLVTHGIQWLPFVDQIIVLVDGQISEVGSYNDLLNHDGAFAQFLKTYLVSEENKEEEEEDEEDDETLQIKQQILQRLDSVLSQSEAEVEGDENIRKKIQRRLSRQISKSEVSHSDTDDKTRTPDGKRRTPDAKKLQKQKSHVEEPPAKKVDGKEKLVQEEFMETGRVQLSVFWTYIKAVGIHLSLLIFVFFAIYQAASIFSNIWLSRWTDDKYLQNASLSNTSEYALKQDMYLGVYGGSGVLQGLAVLIFALIFTIGLVTSARQMHFGMLHNIMRLPMSFFDTTPTGRIVNRFSKDVEVIDNNLPSILRMWMNTTFSVISTIIVISYATPLFLTVIIPLGVLYYFIQRFYIPTSRQLKRVESTTRSPIYTHFSETISGASTIRAYGQADRFISESEHRVDNNLKFYFAGLAANRWLGFRLEFVGAVTVLAAALFSVISKKLGDGSTAGLVGLAISYALQVTASLNWMVRITSDLETNIVSVERVKEYSEVDTEAEWVIDHPRPPQNWPDSGKVEFKNYSVRYREGLDLVIKGISCTINPKEKVGIVGRTGAGKSSLTLSLFRIIEAAGGSINIDDINISTLGLHDVRTKLTILPQDPVLFAGTLRMNLDPFDKYSDEMIWRALQHCHLRDFVQTLSEGLMYECGEGGQNLSVGQRQLVCLGRSLLRKTKILILDEATAAVDLETDDLIQDTIRTEFADCTILTIAHRLNTIMDNDRVLVLDQGHIREFDSPENLLKNKNSVFFGMAKDAGLAS